MVSELSAKVGTKKRVIVFPFYDLPIIIGSILLPSQLCIKKENYRILPIHPQKSRKS